MFYLITGATNSGKDTVAEYMNKKYKLETIVSTTSRPIRPSEVEGREYHFLTADEFQERVEKGEFIEYRKYETVVKGNKEVWYYGVETKNIKPGDQDYVAVMDYHGASEFIKHFGRDQVVLIFVVSSYKERMIRNLLRGDYDEQEWNRRNVDDAVWLNEARKNANFELNNFGVNIDESPIDFEISPDIWADILPFTSEQYGQTKREIDDFMKEVRKGDK